MTATVAPAAEPNASEKHTRPGAVLECELASVLNFAMEQNGVPLVRELVVRNGTSEPLRGAVIEIEAGPGLSEPLRLPVPELAPGEIHRVSPVDVRLSPGRLRSVVEAERGEITCRLVFGDAVLAEQRADVRILAFNEWPGHAAPPGLLAAFVLPNHPVIAALLQTVREKLRESGVPDALDGYQSSNRDRVRTLVQAVYSAVQSLGVGYVGAPPSFETAGQKIRLPDAVLADKLGCCLDLTVLFAAVLEQIGIAPLLVLVRGHAFVAAWLNDDRFPAGVVEDAARLRTQVQLGNVLPLEATAATQSAPVPFDAAVAAAFQRLQDDDAFECAIDVRALRTEYRPLPVRTVVQSSVAEAVENVPAGLAARVLARAAAAAARPEPASAPNPAPADVELRFRRWKEKLLDLTLRNRLLNFRSDVKGAVQLAVPDVALLEDGLHANRSFELLPRPDPGPRDQRDAALAEKRTQEVADAARLADLQRHVVHSRHGPEELWTRARHLDREARTAIEEGGAAVLHLAIGFLRWYETGSSQEPRLAPLLLYPVELTFDPRGRRARMRRLAEDPVLNVTLVEKLRRDHNVDVSSLDALPMAKPADDGDDGVAVGELLRRFREAIQHIPRWEVVEEAHLGLFHFTKFLMWKDLDENAETFLNNAVVRRIASRDTVPLDQKPSIAPNEVDRLHPSELPTVLNADSTQLAAIASALDGQSFVLQGPPGTGKSQTIANLIAATLARHRTVLFVSEKMAALDVVHRRLRDVGLGDFCLELHSHKANKKEVVQSLKSALDHTARTDDSGWKAQGDRLLDARRQLDAYVDALHRSGSLGVSVYEARSRLLELERVADEHLAGNAISTLTSERFTDLRRTVDEFSAVAGSVEPVGEHPFRDARRADWSAAAEEQLRGALAHARSEVRGWDAARAQLTSAFGVGEVTSARAGDLATAACALSLDSVPGASAAPEWAATSARAHRCVEARCRADAQQKGLGARWAPTLLEVAPEALLQRFERWATAFFLVAWIMLWTSRRELRRHATGALPRNAEILADLETLLAFRTARPERESESAWTAGVLGTPADVPPERWAAMLATLDEAHPALRRLEAEGGECARALDSLRAPLPPDRREALVAAGKITAAAAAKLRSAEAGLVSLLCLPPGALPSWDHPRHPVTTVDVLERWESGLRKLRGWCLYRGAAGALERAGLPELAAGHLEARLEAKHLAAVFEKAVLRQWHAAAVDADPVLRDFDARKHSQGVALFRQLDEAQLDASRRHVIAELEQRLPSPNAADVATSEPSLIMREAQKRARHLPIRRLLREIPALLPRLKPCFLMSPLSVAQYLPADGKPFDLVVFDEASQICTHEAIGAIARGRQVVIVGDSRQMPPTSFFSRTDSEEDELPDEDGVVELESVLDEAVAKLIPQQWLGWHYRSRHESLIEFSNRHIYDGRLDVFPAATFPSEDLGVGWCRVPGVYQGGNGAGGRTNRIEAEALVAHLVERLRRFEPGERTFGVVTFNVTQQQLVLDLLDEARIDPDIERHFTGTESVFVKNLENVQGDERDEILFSICYAPDAGHHFRMHYGPLSAAGGERRLNVAVTRARQKLTVFSSIDPEQIDRSRTNARGAWLLREFLQHARDRSHGTRPGGSVNGVASAQEQAIATALRSAGWTVDTGIGCSGYKLDLAVHHPHDPQRYGVAVESDGPAYRSARSTRDRDRLRADVLEAMGWNLVRSWSTGWWFDPDAPRVLVEDVQRALDGTGKPAPAPESSITKDVAPVAPRFESSFTPAHATRASAPVPPPLADAIPRYQVSRPAAAGTAEQFYARGFDANLLDHLVDVVAVEGPIHEDLLARRVANGWGIARVTKNPQQRLAELVVQLEAAGRLKHHGEFVWPPTQDPVTYRAFRAPTNEVESERELPMIAPEEIANAAAAVLRDAGSLDRNALTREVARVFGVQRLGEKVRESIERGLQVLETSGRCATTNGRVQLV